MVKLPRQRGDGPYYPVGRLRPLCGSPPPRGWPLVNPGNSAPVDGSPACAGIFQVAAVESRAYLAPPLTSGLRYTPRASLCPRTVTYQGEFPAPVCGLRKRKRSGDRNGF